MRVSIIICTRNNLPSLRLTLAALGRVEIPADVTVELLLVDNGSTDGTAACVDCTTLAGMECRGLHEPRTGQVNARNCGLAAATGEIILFTDDDVRPEPDWLRQAVRHLGSGDHDAMIGCVKLAPELERPWMNRRLRAVLAVSEGLEDGWLTDFIGANMGFHRRVLARVPRFDPELGPGTLGFCDDTLFSRQLRRAGFRFVRAPDAVVWHHCAANRLLRSSYLQAARRAGESEAYVRYHWEHGRVWFPGIQALYLQAKALRRRLLSSPDRARPEGCAAWEFALTREQAFVHRFREESRQPRRYEKFGLVKLAAPAAR